MQYQNEQTIAVMVKTIQQAIDAISHELDKPSVPNVPEVIKHSFVPSEPVLKLTRAEQELYDLLAERKHGINRDTICNALEISPNAYRQRLEKLRKTLEPAGIKIATKWVGSRKPKYRLAIGQ